MIGGCKLLFNVQAKVEFPKTVRIKSIVCKNGLWTSMLTNDIVNKCIGNSLSVKCGNWNQHHETREDVLEEKDISVSRFRHWERAKGIQSDSLKRFDGRSRWFRDDDES